MNRSKHRSDGFSGALSPLSHCFVRGITSIITNIMRKSLKSLEYNKYNEYNRERQTIQKPNVNYPLTTISTIIILIIFIIQIAKSKAWQYSFSYTASNVALDVVTKLPIEFIPYCNRRRRNTGIRKRKRYIGTGRIHFRSTTLMFRIFPDVQVGATRYITWVHPTPDHLRARHPTLWARYRLNSSKD